MTVAAQQLQILQMEESTNAPHLPIDYRAPPENIYQYYTRVSASEDARSLKRTQGGQWKEVEGRACANRLTKSECETPPPGLLSSGHRRVRYVPGAGWVDEEGIIVIQRLESTRYV